MSALIHTLKKRAFSYGYGIGEFGFTFFNFFVAYYLMYYLTNVLLLPVAVAAVLFSVIQWVEGILMVAAGIFIDLRSAKTGKYSTWVFLGSVICGVSMIVFFTNFHLSVAWSVVIFALFYTLCYVGFNLMWVGFRVLLDPMSDTPDDAVLNVTASAQMGSLAGIIFSIIGTKLLYGFSSMQKGFTVSSIVYATVMIVCMGIVCLFAKKKDLMVKTEAVKAPSLKGLLKIFNGQFLILFFSVTFREAANTILPTLLVYYFEFVVKDPGWMTSYLLVINFTGLFGYFVSPYITMNFGKKKTFIASCIIAAIALFAVNFSGQNKVLFIALMIVYTFGGLFTGGMIPVFMNDIAVFNEANYGVRGHGFTASIGGCAIRFSQVIGGAMASMGLLSIGYSKEAEFTAQMGGKITHLMTYGCMAVLLISALVFVFYKIDGDTLSNAYKKEKEDRGK
jgi:Na+/melibiose symporter-like transporter